MNAEFKFSQCQHVGVIRGHLDVLILGVLIVKCVFRKDVVYHDVV